MYSKFVDEKRKIQLPCYSCGTDIPEDCEAKYLERKGLYCTVLPTCAIDACAKSGKKWKLMKKRKAGGSWKAKDRLEKKLKLMRKRKRDQ